MENEASNRIQHELITQLVFLRLSGILYACDHNFPRMLNPEARTTATSLSHGPHVLHIPTLGTPLLCHHDQLQVSTEEPLARDENGHQWRF